MKSAKIKRMRNTLGITQAQFASTLGISQGFLSDLEKGSKTPSKSLSLLLKKLQSDQTVDFEDKVVSINETTPQNKTQVDLKLKYIALMEEHVKALSKIINLREVITCLNSELYSNTKSNQNLHQGNKG
jgi:DNA-binding XRE family transcriptional regulator